jgi:hypothetical protein
MTGINVSVSDYGYTGYNLDIINMSQTGRYTVAGRVSLVYGYTGYNLEIISMSHIGVTTP